MANKPDKIEIKI